MSAEHLSVLTPDEQRIVKPKPKVIDFNQPKIRTGWDLFNKPEKRVAKNIVNFPNKRVKSPVLIYNSDGEDDTNIVEFDSSRNKPTVDSQEATLAIDTHALFPAQGSLDFSKDFELIDELQLRFGSNRRERLSHDPVLERARFQRAKTEKERQEVRQSVIGEMETTLMERARSAQSTVMLYFGEDGHVYSPDFPGEPYDQVLQRGLEHSKRNGFVDYAREVAEFKGWKKVMATLYSKDTPDGSKEIVISAPSTKKGTSFTDNFVDIYTKNTDPQTGRVVITMIRFASGSDNDTYRKIVTKFEPHYFKAQEQDEDVYYKAHPILIEPNTDPRNAEQFFEEEFIKQKGALEKGKTRHYLDECREFIMRYVDQICAVSFDPEKVKLAFNAAVNIFDDLRKGVIGSVKDVVKGVFQRVKNAFSRVFSSVDKAIDFYGRRVVEEIMAGCALSAGFSVGIFTGIKSGILSIGAKIGSASGFLESDSMGSLYFNCSYCGAINKRPREGFVKTCQGCGTDKIYCGPKEAKEVKEETKTEVYEMPKAA